MRLPGATHRLFCFQYEEDTLNFYQALISRLADFGLEISKEKTKIVKLDKDRNGEVSKGSTFDFLGFTHYIGKDKNGRKRPKRKTSKKKDKVSLLRFKEWIKANRTMPTKQLMKTIKAKTQGHCNCYGITDSRNAVSNFIDECKRLLFKWLNRRSQSKSFDWDKFNLYLKKYPLPRAKTYVRIFDLGAGSSYLL